MRQRLLRHRRFQPRPNGFSAASADCEIRGEQFETVLLDAKTPLARIDADDELALFGFALDQELTFLVQYLDHRLRGVEFDDQRPVRRAQLDDNPQQHQGEDDTHGDGGIDLLPLAELR